MTQEPVPLFSLTEDSWLNPRVTWRGLLLTGLVGFLALGVVLWIWDPHGYRDIESRLRLGMTGPEVIRSLGEWPDHVYDRETAPDDYYVDGWSRKERAITHRVLIFEFGYPICYVWFDEHGHVEDFFVGGS